MRNAPRAGGLPLLSPLRAAGMLAALGVLAVALPAMLRVGTVLPASIIELSPAVAGEVTVAAAFALLLLLNTPRQSPRAVSASASRRGTAPASMQAPMAGPPHAALAMPPAGPVPESPVRVMPATPSAEALARLAQRPVLKPERPHVIRRFVAGFGAESQTHPHGNTPVQVPIQEVPAMPAPESIPVVPRNASTALTESVTALLEDSGQDESGTPLLNLARLRLRSVARLADITRSFDRMEEEAAPLLDVVAELISVRGRFSENLEQAMQPLVEFADRWDDNLVALAERMDSGSPVPQIDIAAERRRIAEIRAQVPRRQSLLLEQFEIEKRAVDAALTVFDDQVARLEAQLSAARVTAEAIGDSMRTADFARTVEFLRRRMERLASLAERGAATPEEILEELPAAASLVADDEQMLAHSPYLRSVLEVLDPSQPTPDLRPAPDGITRVEFGVS
ncbi:MAG: hypothetical protein WC273_09505 [Dehalococcoidia bacterium]